MIHLITHNLIWSEGKYILLISIFLVIIGYYIQWIAFGAALIFLIFVIYFFRSPTRICKEALEDSHILICPADGRVVDISPIDHEYYTYRISIFLSIFDVHVNWIPYSGIIKSITYKKGKFVPAFLAKSSYFNEHNDIVISLNNNLKYNDKPISICVRQIAGMIARRISWWVQVGDYVTQGQKYGMIRFGSRVDIFIPHNIAILVKHNQRVYGGYTALAKIK